MKLLTGAHSEVQGDVRAWLVTLAPMRRRPSQLELWPRAFDRRVELDWSDPVVSRRLLREHLDQSHDGASRRESVIDSHVARLSRLLPPPPARVLDAACGPGLYAVRLAEAGHVVTAVDIGPAVVRHARGLARRRGVADRLDARCADLRMFASAVRYDAAIMIYHVLEGFPRRSQAGVLRRLAAVLADGAPLVVEMRLRADQPEGRISTWEVVPRSLLSDRRHLLLVETVHDRRAHTYVLRETAVFDDGSAAVQQTSSALSRLGTIPSLFARAGLRVDAIYDGWSRFRATALSESVLVVARRR
jgi:SAM-dependent methyltransferase